MWRKRTTASFLIPISICLLPLANHAETFSYDGFVSPTRLIFQADAALQENRVRLTPSAQSKVGGIWLETKQPVLRGFETIFQFQITDVQRHGADGLAFVIQNSGTPLLGLSGHNLGFGGRSNCFAVKFDNYHWIGNSYVKYDEVAVNFNEAGNSKSNTQPVIRTLASVTNTVMFTDERIHTVKIIYQPGKLRVFLDDLGSPLITVGVDLEKALELEHGSAWVGFAAATGADCQNQDVIAWSFSTKDSTRPLQEVTQTPAVVREANIPALTSAPRIFDATRESVSLPKDVAFGHALPTDIGLNYQIEASTDLNQWSSVTNLVLYFKDVESTNYDHRFYRFLPK